MPGHRHRDILIIGGGVIGLSCAYQLALRGCTVRLVERNTVGSACSHGNCGLVVPSHVLPLCVPGAVRRMLPVLLQRNAPLRIKPQLDRAFLSWMWRFMRRCRTDCMMEAARARHDLLTRSQAMYEQMLAEEAIDCDWQKDGCLFLHLDESGLDHFEPTNDLLTREFGVAAKRLNSAQLRALEPAVRENVAGAWFYEADAHLRPDKLLRGWRAAAERRGVTIIESCEVRDMTPENGQVSLDTSHGPMNAEAVVVATGAWTPMMNQQLGVKVPIQPGKGYSITSERPAGCPTRPMILEGHRVAVTPMRSGYRLGSMMEFVGYDTSLSPKRLALLREGASQYLHEPIGAENSEEWYGWRPMTPTGLPIIAPAPRSPHLFIAAGHNMIGLSTAPATGLLMADLVTGETPSFDPAPFGLR